MVQLTGTVQGRLIRADGNTVLLTGSVTDGKAVVTLPQSAYVSPGRFVLAIMNVASSVVTVVYAATGNIARTTSGASIDPGSVVPDITQLLAEIDEMRLATAAANAAAEYAVGDIAPAFDASQTYTAGQYVIYTDGKLYRLTADHAANVTWANTSKTRVTVGGDLAPVRIQSNLNRMNIGNDFSSSANYSIGDFVIYDGILYLVHKPWTAGAWDPDEVGADKTFVNASAMSYVLRDALLVSLMFDPTRDYGIGEYTIYDYRLYQFTAAFTHTGSFPSTGIKRAYLAEDVYQSIYNIANQFSASVDYNQGDLVIYGNLLYRFTSDHSAGAWNSSHVERTTAATTLHRSLASIAQTWVSGTSYANGDFVIYKNRLHEFFADNNDARPVYLADVVKFLQNSIANRFSTALDYSQGDLVMYENKLYRFTSDHSAGAWNSSHVEGATAASTLHRSLASLAQTWESGTSYAKGDYVIYKNRLHKFFAANNDARPVYLADIVKGLENDAEIAVYYGKSQSLTSSQKTQARTNIGANQTISVSGNTLVIS